MVPKFSFLSAAVGIYGFTPFCFSLSLEFQNFQKFLYFKKWSTVPCHGFPLPPWPASTCTHTQTHMQMAQVKPYHGQGSGEEEKEEWKMKMERKRTRGK